MLLFGRVLVLAPSTLGGWNFNSFSSYKCVLRAFHMSNLLLGEPLPLNLLSRILNLFDEPIDTLS